jgi:Ni2+-binding GTPase involved in maturation of urease and hydrogenase
MKRVRFLMVGGFLGAGKTTALARLARHYVDQGLRVALVTNDQAYGLVDTESLRAQGFPVGEVTGACFCCKFNDLVETVRELADDQHPDVILAEPVGSCTDLLATVIEPLRHFYREAYETGPLAVLLKPEHGQKILAAEPGVGFSAKAAYIFLKQLEEADIIAVNKVDKLSPAEVEKLLTLVRQRFPGKQVLAISARQGAGFGELIEACAAGRGSEALSPEIDYDIYAEGEAELGWLNCTVRFDSEPETAAAGFALDELLLQLATRLSHRLATVGAEPAHLKILGCSDDARQRAIANLVSSTTQVELSLASAARLKAVNLTVNARVAMPPEELTQVVESEVEKLAGEHGLRCSIENMQSFRPGRPIPTHRMPVTQG